MRYKYQLDNLNCAHCAGKIEAKIAETNGFEDVSFNFATKLLNFKSEKQNPVSEIQAICDSIENGVTVVDKTPKTNLKKYTYTLDNLNCAHCAGKIETKIAETDGFEDVNFNFATKLLNFKSEKQNPVSEIQAICDSIENGVTVVDKTPKNDITTKAEPEITKKKINHDTIFLAISIVLAVVSEILHLTLDGVTAVHYVVLAACFVATILSGYKVFIKGAKNILKLRIDETTLMAVAVIAAFCLGDFVEAAMVTILFSIGEIFEDRAVDASRRDIEKLANIRPDTATIIVDGAEQVVPAESVEIGSIKSSHTKEFRLTALLLKVKRLSTHRLSQAKAFLLTQVRAVRYSAVQSTAVTLLPSKPQNISATVPQQEFFSLLKMPPLKRATAKSLFQDLPLFTHRLLYSLQLQSQ